MLTIKLLQKKLRMARTKGKIFRIKRFSVLDGPGIRTFVFLKGCPLNCVWCHSPEGIDSEISIWFNQSDCISCSRCVVTCPEEALKMNSEYGPNVLIDRLRCKVSGDCVKVCPTNAIQFTGTVTSLEEVFNEIVRDIAFYNSSGGGVTLTGGEPLFQPDFAFEILSWCKDKNIHTAIETSMFASLETIKRIAPVTDLVYADLKIIDSITHQHFTGQSNEIIKENFAFLARSGKNIIVRVPLVPNVTDTTENKVAIQEFVSSFNKEIPIEYIQYNLLTANNYNRLGIPFLMEHISNECNNLGK